MKAFIFDLDGTLSDSVPVIVENALKTCAELDKYPTQQDIISYIGRSLFDTGEALIGPGKGQLYIDTYQKNYAGCAVRLHAFPGIIEMLEDLHRCGALLGLCTAKREFSARESMQVIGAEPYMDAFVYSELTERHKPFGDPALKAAELLGLSPADCLFIGDARHDIGCARDAGMQVCAVSWGAGTLQELEEARPDYLLHSVDELHRLLLSLLEPPADPV